MEHAIIGILGPSAHLAQCLFGLNRQSEAETILKRAVAGSETLEGLQGEHTTPNMEKLLEVLPIQRNYDELDSLRQEWFERGVPFFEVLSLVYEAF